MKVGAAREQQRLRDFAGVAHEKRAKRSPALALALKHRDERIFVDGIPRHPDRRPGRSQETQAHAIVSLPEIARFRMHDRNVFAPCLGQRVLVCVPAVSLSTVEDHIGLERSKDRSQSANVVPMRMRDENCVHVMDAVPDQEWDDNALSHRFGNGLAVVRATALELAAGVDHDDVAARRFDHGSVALADVEERDAKVVTRRARWPKNKCTRQRGDGIGDFRRHGALSIATWRCTARGRDRAAANQGGSFNRGWISRGRSSATALGIRRFPPAPGAPCSRDRRRLCE